MEKHLSAKITQETLDEPVLTPTPTNESVPETVEKDNKKTANDEALSDSDAPEFASDARCNKMLSFLESRNYEMNGIRNNFIIVYGILLCSGKGKLTEEETVEFGSEIRRVNSMFSHPLKSIEIRHLIRYIARRPWHKIPDEDIVKKLGDGVKAFL